MMRGMQDKQPSITLYYYTFILERRLSLIITPRQYLGACTLSVRGTEAMSMRCIKHYISPWVHQMIGITEFNAQLAMFFQVF